MFQHCCTFETIRERDVGILCMYIDDDLALEAWTQTKKEREREKGT